MSSFAGIPGQVPVLPAEPRPSTPQRMQMMQRDEDYFLTAYAGESIKLKEKSKDLGSMITDFLLMIDTNHSGELSAAELDEAADIIRLAKKGKDNNSAELNYKHMPKSVADVLSQWDADKSGSVGISELVAAADAQKKMKDENRMMKKLLIGAIIVIAILMAGTFGLALTAAEMAKDTKPDTSGIMTTTAKTDDNGEATSTNAAMAGVTEKITLADIVKMPADHLAELESIAFTHKEQFFSLKVAGVMSSSAGITVHLLPSHALAILPDGSVTLDGEAVDLSEARRLGEAAESRSLLAGREEDRRLDHYSWHKAGGGRRSARSSCDTKYYRSGGCSQSRCGSTVTYSYPPGCTLR